MKKIIMLAVLFSVTAISFSALAKDDQENQGNQQGVDNSVTYQTDAAVDFQGNKVKNQVKTQNAGENTQLQVNTQEMVETGKEMIEAGEKILKDNEEALEAGKKMIKAYGKSDNARQHMDVVAEKVEELLSDENGQGRIGQQVKEIATQQKQAQGVTEKQLDKLESRWGITKKLFGANRKAIQSLKQQIEQDQIRMRQLQQLQIQTTNQADRDQIQAMVQALIEQDTSLSEQIYTEEQSKGMFNWFTKLFTR